MEIRSILLSLILASGAFAAAAPAAGAAAPEVPVYACAETKYTACEGDVCVAISRMVPQCVEVCRIGETECVGFLVCVDQGGRDVCVPDPCYTTACTRAGADVKPPVCVLYAYVADYHWYWVCANPRDAACPVYFQEQHGVTVTRQCVLPHVDFVHGCILLAQDLDYAHYACVNPADPACAVYLLTTGGPSPVKRCYGVLPDDAALVAASALVCVPTSLGGLDYHSELCADPKDLGCPVYRNDWNGRHCANDAFGVQPIQFCVPTSGGLDYHSYLCVDSTNPKCAVYTLDWNGKHCGVLSASPRADALPACTPSFGSMDHQTWFCVDASDPKCPVYQVTRSGKHCGAAVLGGLP